MAADIGHGKLSAATARVPPEYGFKPGVEDAGVGTSVVDGMPTKLKSPLEGPAGPWRGAVNVEVEFMTAVKAASRPGQSQSGGGATYICLGRSIRFPGGADAVRCLCPPSEGPSYLGKGTGSGEKELIAILVVVSGQVGDSAYTTSCGVSARKEGR